MTKTARAKIVAQILTDNGQPVSSPDEGTLDDVEWERWNVCLQIVQTLDDEAWQPIETADRNSKARLVWCPERQNTYVVSWTDTIPGWIHFGAGRELREEPSHWMPLPKPPEPET